MSPAIVGLRRVVLRCTSSGYQGGLVLVHYLLPDGREPVHAIVPSNGVKGLQIFDPPRSWGFPIHDTEEAGEDWMQGRRCTSYYLYVDGPEFWDVKLRSEDLPDTIAELRELLDSTPW